MISKRPPYFGSLDAFGADMPAAGIINFGNISGFYQALNTSAWAALIVRSTVKVRSVIFVVSFGYQCIERLQSEAPNGAQFR